MKPTALALAAVLVPSLAVAQAAPPSTPPAGDAAAAPTVDAAVAPDPGDDPPEHPAPAPYLARVNEPPAAPPPAAPATSKRPKAWSLGLGLGYRMPVEILTPNLTSLRLRVTRCLTLEPSFALTRTTTDDDDGFMVIEDLTTIASVGLGARQVVKGLRRVDLSVTGAAEVAFVTTDPEGPANAQLTSVLSLDYGLALDYWIDRNWSISVNASNSLVRRTSTTRQTGSGNPEVSSTSTTLGLVLAPTMSVMAHLYL